MAELRPEVLDTGAHREALGAMLAQFLHGEEISFTAVPIGFEFVTEENLLREGDRQLEDEKRHHKMFDAERTRLGLPRDEPNEAMVRFYDTVIDRLKRRDAIGGIIPGCFMLEGAAFSTLLIYGDTVDPMMSKVFKEIVADEARHIALNISVVQNLIAEDPRNLDRLVEVHREDLPLLFSLFTSFREINGVMGVDNEWFTMRCLFHHAQRIRRLHLPDAVARVMLADTTAVARTAR